MLAHRGRAADRHDNPLDIQGTIKFTDDIDYWTDASFPFVFQNLTSYFLLGGDDVFIYGGVYTSLAFPIPKTCDILAPRPGDTTKEFRP